MSLKDMGKLVGQVQAMQGRMAEMQNALARRTFEGSAGGGMVTAVVTGDLRVRELRIEPDIFDAGDREMIQDLTAAAINAALANAQQVVQDELQRITGGMQLPGFSPDQTG